MLAALIAKLLLRFPVLGRIPWRLVAAVAAFCLTWWAIHAYNAHEQAIGAAEKEKSYQEGYAAAQKQAEQKERMDRDMWASESQSYEETIYALRHPAVPVPEHHLVCHNTTPASRPVPADPAPAGEPGQANPAELGAANEFDPGPAFDAYALDVQEMAIQCSKIQEGYLKLSGQSH